MLKRIALSVIVKAKLPTKRIEPKSCHIGGCKNSFFLKNSAQQHFLNISLQTAKTNGNADFCYIFPKCQSDTLKCHFERRQTP